MSQIMTCSKKMFDPLQPEVALIDIEDIAHALSMLCRANGHFPTFYSVGQHCINCAREAKARNYTLRVQLACLLHDASEAYLSDVTRPVKAELPRYKEIEEPLQETIWNKWLKTPLSEEENRLVFLVDDDILAHEFINIMGENIVKVIPVLSSQPEWSFTGFAVCRAEFLGLFSRLLTEIENEQ